MSRLAAAYGLDVWIWYPVQDWDVAYAVTEALECINPRPTDEAVIFQATNPYTIGFIT